MSGAPNMTTTLIAARSEPSVAIRTPLRLPRAAAYIA
jgi:hypothetical protein